MGRDPYECQALPSKALVGRCCVRKSGTFSARGLGLKNQMLTEEESEGHGSKEDGEGRLEGAEQKA